MLPNREEEFFAVTINQYLLKCLIEIESFPWHVLPVPYDPAIFWVDCKCRVRVKSSVCCSHTSASWHPRFCLRGSPVDEIQIWVIATRNPGISTTTQFERNVSPGVVTEFTWSGNCESPPELLTSCCIVRGNKARFFKKSPAPVNAVNDFSASYDWSRDIRVALLVISYLGLPNYLACSCIQGDQPSVLGGDENLILVDRNRAELGEECSIPFWESSLVFPQQLTSCCIKCLYGVHGVCEIHDSPTNERCRLVSPLVHRPHPGQSQVGYVFTVDLIEWAISLAVEGSPIHQPIPRVGVHQLLISYWTEICNLMECRRAITGATATECCPGWGRWASTPGRGCSGRLLWSCGACQCASRIS